MKIQKHLNKNPKIFADKWCLYARQWHHLSFRPTCDHHASIHANSPHHCQRWEGDFHTYKRTRQYRCVFFKKSEIPFFFYSFAGTYSTLVVSFHLQRHMGDFVIQVHFFIFIPCSCGSHNLSSSS